MTVPCPLCGKPVNLIPREETQLRVTVDEQYIVDYPSDVAACSACEWAASVTATKSGVVVKEMV